VSSGFGKFMDLDIPEERIWTRNIRDAARHYDVLPPDEYKGLMLSILGGAVMDLEERLIAVERRLGPEQR
jgi:hypothetical protein